MRGNVRKLVDGGALVVRPLGNGAIAYRRIPGALGPCTEPLAGVSLTPPAMLEDLAAAMAVTRRHVLVLLRRKFPAFQRRAAAVRIPHPLSYLETALRNQLAADRKPDLKETTPQENTLLDVLEWAARKHPAAAGTRR